MNDNRNNNHNQQRSSWFSITKSIENENIPSTQKPENQNPLSVSVTSKSVIDTLQIKEGQGLIKKPLLVSLFLLFLAGIIIVFSLQRKNKKLKS